MNLTLFYGFFNVYFCGSIDESEDFSGFQWVYGDNPTVMNQRMKMHKMFYNAEFKVHSTFGRFPCTRRSLKREMFPITYRFDNFHHLH